MSSHPGFDSLLRRLEKTPEDFDQLTAAKDDITAEIKAMSEPERQELVRFVLANRSSESNPVGWDRRWTLSNIVLHACRVESLDFDDQREARESAKQELIEQNGTLSDYRPSDLRIQADLQSQLCNSLESSEAPNGIAMRVHIRPPAEILFDAIVRRYPSGSEDRRSLTRARDRIFFELQRNHPSVWLLPAENYLNAFEIYEPPLKAIFRMASDDAIDVYAFEELAT